MKSHIFTTFALWVCCTAWAGSKPRDYFMFPDAVFTTHGAIVESRFKPSENWSVEKKEDAPHFFRGAINGASGIKMRWELIQRTEHGDVYIVAFSHPKEGEKKFSLLFEGEDPVEVSAFGAYIKLQNQPNK